MTWNTVSSKGAARSSLGRDDGDVVTVVGVVAGRGGGAVPRSRALDARALSRGVCTRRRAARRSRAERRANTAASLRRRAPATARSTPRPPASAPTRANTGSPGSKHRPDRPRSTLTRHATSSSARRVAQLGRRRRRCRWAAAGSALAGPPAAAPCWATTRARGGTSAASGTAPTGSAMRPMAHHPTRTRGRGRPGNLGVSRGCCTRDSRPSLLDSSFTLWAPETRVSKRLHYGWWVRLSSWRGSRAAYCVSCFVSLPNPAADGEQTTRKTEGCLAWKARRCRWRARVAALARRSARPRAASTPPPATCPASPAARKTSACADTAPTHCSRRPSSCSRRGHNQNRSHYPQSHHHRRSQLEQQRVQRCPPQVHRWPRRVRRWRPPVRQWASGRPPGPSRSRARPTASWSSAPRSCDNQAINYHAILFIRYVTRELKGRYHSCGLV